MSIYYVVNVPDIASETINQETVIINFTSGLYYHTDSVGSIIWQLLENGASLDSIVEHLSEIFTGDSNEISKEISTFITKLEQESLIVPLKEIPMITTDSILIQTSDHITFSPPTLNTYTDMAELLLLDPVHEVEDRGKHSVGNQIQ